MYKLYVSHVSIGLLHHLKSVYSFIAVAFIFENSFFLLNLLRTYTARDLNQTRIEWLGCHL